jgi:hypothetical protein
MTETKNICEDFSFQDLTEQYFDKVARTLNNMRYNAVIMLAFFVGVSSFVSNALKKIFAKKNPKRITGKALLNIPQTIDKAKFRAKIDALLACFN